MHHNSVTTNHTTPFKSTIFRAALLAIIPALLMTGTALAKDISHERRKDRIISTGTEYIIIKEDEQTGDRIIRSKPDKPEEECNPYTDGQYPIIIELKPDISNYKK